MKVMNIACLALLCTAASCVGEPPESSSEWKTIPSEETQTVSVETATDNSTETTPVYKVKFETSKGDVLLEVHPEWAPLGAARFKELVQSGYYDEARFFRVIEGFMAQFGINADPKLSAQWREKPIKDDPNKKSNTRGMVTFATAGPNTRTTQIFINFGDNSFLDRQGFSPFAQVIEGMDVVDSFYNGYGEGAPNGKGPSQGRLQQEGNAYLNKDFPKLDYIKKATVVE